MRHPAIALLFLLPSCAHVDRTAVAQWAADKAERWARCQLQHPASREQAEACLGDFARDLGTDTCAEVGRRLDGLPSRDVP